MKKKLFIVSAIIMIIAAFIVAAIGFNVDLRYRNHTVIVVPIGEEFNAEEIKNMAKEVFDKSDVSVEKAGLYNDTAYISVAKASDEQIANLKDKVNAKYSISQKVYVKIGDEYTVEDVQTIVNEALGKDNTVVEKDKEDETYAAIEANLLTKKDIEKINDKLNEKYSLSNSADNIGATNVVTTKDIPRVRLTDMAKQYLLFTVIATIVVLVYFAVIYRKLGVKDVLQDAVLTLAFAELLYMSIIAITRFPINKLTVIAAFAIYIVLVIYLNARYMSKIESKKEKQK